MCGKGKVHTEYMQCTCSMPSDHGPKTMFQIVFVEWLSGIFSDYSVQHIVRNRSLNLYIIITFSNNFKLEYILTLPLSPQTW